jgi:hypothetical protein
MDASAGLVAILRDARPKKGALLKMTGRDTLREEIRRVVLHLSLWERSARSAG